MLDTFAVPTIDPFLDHDPPYRWAPDQWLAGVVLALLFHAGGWALLYVVAISSYVASYFGILRPLAVKTQATPLAATAATLIALYLGLVHFILRPLIFNYLLFSVVITICYGLRAKGTRSHQAFFLPALFLLWANVHGAFVLGLFAVGALLPERFARVFIRHASRADETRAALWAALLLLACLGATFINPFGSEMHRQILAYQQDEYVKGMMEEWHPLILASPEGVAFAATAIVCALGFLTAAMTRRHVLYLGELVLITVLGYLSVGSVRVLPFFGMAACRPLAVSLTIIASALYARFPRALRLTGRVVRSASGHFHAPNDGRIFLGALLLALVSFALITGRVPFFPHPPGPSPDHLPLAAVTYLKQQVPPEETATVIAHPNWGGTIIFFGEGRLKPIADDRNRMLGGKFYQEFFRRLTPENDWYSYLKAHGAEYLLLSLESPLGKVIRSSEALPLLYEDKRVSVFAVP